MKDIVIVLTSLQIIFLFILDYFNVHSFGAEAAIASLNAVALMIIYGKDNKR